MSADFSTSQKRQRADAFNMLKAKKKNFFLLNTQKARKNRRRNRK
jgi:hypothetical protein